MKHIPELFLFFLMLLIAVREGYVLRWALNGRPEKESKIWHSLGSVMRAIPLVMVIYYAYPDWRMIVFVTLLWANWAWTVYDAAINLINGWPIYYQGKSSATEKIFKKQLIWTGKALLFIGTILFTVFYFELI